MGMGTAQRNFCIKYVKQRLSVLFVYRIELVRYIRCVGLAQTIICGEDVAYVKIFRCQLERKRCKEFLGESVE